MIPVLVLLALFADGRLVFTKVFPGSQPPYIGISVQQSGAAELKTTRNDDQPVTFQLTVEETASLFAAARKVNLKEPLESGLKVARMGLKTIRLEEDGKGTEQTFNYTANPDARALAEWFENISETEQCFLVLERTAKYDKVGVNDALLALQVTWEKKRLVAAQQFLPLLDRITRNETYMQLARNRAAALAATFRALPTSSAPGSK